ncbi:unnamed protein product [Spirodela intermedia]|uniref:Uncharacterized protein n=1 Tax=Spirodela intermedia TaxID=51605 RepID=A0A7I8LHE9_SPIIN|nr:unnamed protein product [Spirodela intermedia]
MGSLSRAWAVVLAAACFFLVAAEAVGEAPGPGAGAGAGVLPPPSNHWTRGCNKITRCRGPPQQALAPEETVIAAPGEAAAAVDETVIIRPPPIAPTGADEVAPPPAHFVSRKCDPKGNCRGHPPALSPGGGEW